MTERDRSQLDAEIVERMERGLPARSQEEEETRAAYQRLIDRIGDVEQVQPPPGWEDRAMERWRREAQPRPARRRVPWRPIAGGITIAAVVATVVLWSRCGAREAPALEVAVDRTGPPSRQEAAAVGDTLRVRVRVDEPHVELRVYRDQVLIARCPGDDRCRRDGASLAIGVVMDRPGRYEAIRLASGAPLPAPRAGLDVDELAAREHGARVAREPPITVR
ncbi:MAG: hypothetical protein KIT31_01545 [Deltaproteobacteria bacterium]|nr:hypothetical protein [Deltaproteobacteria bacterium]